MSLSATSVLLGLSSRCWFLQQKLVTTLQPQPQPHYSADICAAVSVILGTCLCLGRHLSVRCVPIAVLVMTSLSSYFVLVAASLGGCLIVRHVFLARSQVWLSIKLEVMPLFGEAW